MRGLARLYLISESRAGLYLISESRAGLHLIRESLAGLYLISEGLAGLYLVGELSGGYRTGVGVDRALACARDGLAPDFVVPVQRPCAIANTN